MKLNNQIIISFILLGLIIFLIVSRKYNLKFYQVWLHYTTPTTENFITNEYADCLAKGFNREFCLQKNLPSDCLCSDGRRGKFLPGAQGNCVCGDSSYGYMPPFHQNPSYPSSHNHTYVPLHHVADAIQQHNHQEGRGGPSPYSDFML